MRILLAGCLIGSIVHGALAGEAQQKKGPAAMVRAEDLYSEKCEIVGFLGKPYGTILSIRGVWEGWEHGLWKLPTGERPFSIRITEVDGEKLPPEKQVVIDANYVKWLRDRTLEAKPVRGEEVAGRVFESGGYVRHPREVDEMLAKAPAQDYFRFRFYSFLYFIDYLPVANLGKK